ncbi:MAG: alpha/beta hydrolase, partial [Planctomycetaceae bacterium]|nr:alpha/beta hydrolase [Planctomycetaceae bacterium]
KHLLFEQVSAINHLSKEDAPAQLIYESRLDTPITDRRVGMHHPRFGRVLKDRMDELGVECRLATGVKDGTPQASQLILEFIERHLAPAPLVEENLTYGTVDGMELQLDLARPDGAGPFPVLLFIHGGGWYTGGRRTYRAMIEEAARRGYVAATISYRLMQFDEAEKETTTATTIFPAQVHDAKAAVRWLRANASTYHIDPARIGVTGHSAGGHLSLMLGLTDADAQLEGLSGHPEESSRVQAVVNVFGPTDMAACHDASSVAWIFRLVMGGTPEEVPDMYRAASPVNYASADDPPVLTIHGDRDRLVPIAQATTLEERIHSAGGSHTLLILEGQGHGFGGEYRQRERDATWHFFDQHLKP